MRQAAATTGKFGSDTLLYRPELRERVEVGPCSYLEASLKHAASKSQDNAKHLKKLGKGKEKRKHDA